MLSDSEQSQHITRYGVVSDKCLVLPSPDADVLPGVVWGRHDCLFTPAYWAAQAFYHSEELAKTPIRMGRTLTEEVAACLLGGHGTPAEVGAAAFDAVRAGGLLCGRPVSEYDILAVLNQPLSVGQRVAKYRFARRRSRYLAAAIGALRQVQVPETRHIAFRDFLIGIDGIGLKTASWITRNWFDSDCVAVLDVHVLRAGYIMRIFPRMADVARDYRSLERTFLQFASAITVRASRLDALIWRQMKFAGQLGLRAASRALQDSTTSNTLF